MNYKVYYLPANFTDAGKILGRYGIRNVVEAVLLGVPAIFICAYLLPLELTAKIIVTMTIVIPLAGFALIGINDESLTQYMSAWLKWHKSRRIITYKGEVDYHGFERTYIRWKNRRTR